ncbi:MAG: IS30 family transposase [Anaerolineales bacterium]
MSSYTQLTLILRYQISALLKMGHPQKDIAQAIGVDGSTISRELRRNSTKEYSYHPWKAHEKALRRRASKVKRRITASDWELVEEKIRLDWSPEQISGWLEKNTSISISHERIYQYIYEDQETGGDLHEHLRGPKRRRKHAKGEDGRGKIPHRVSIEERPEVVERRVHIPVKESTDSENSRPPRRANKTGEIIIH